MFIEAFREDHQGNSSTIWGGAFQLSSPPAPLWIFK
jgi:hypothetical protein